MNEWMGSLNKERKTAKINQIEILELKNTISEMEKSLDVITVNWRLQEIKYVSDFED